MIRKFFRCLNCRERFPMDVFEPGEPKRQGNRPQVSVAQIAEALKFAKIANAHAVITRHCHVWTPPVLQGENRFETAVELAVMYPAFSLRYTDRWP